MASEEQVTRVIDGDTFETAGRPNSIRLANVDAPEEGEIGYTEATNALKALILGKMVSIDTVARDDYGRSVAEVKVGTLSVNKAMREKTKK